MASGGADDSRLLRGKALQSAEEWARDKNLSYQDKQYLAASKEKEIQEEIAVKEQEATLERERKDKDATQARNQLLSKANQKAQRITSIGAIALIVTLIGSAIVGLSSRKQLDETHDEVVAVQNLNKLAGVLEKNTDSNSEGITFNSNEALRLSALSFNVSNHQLKQALVFATTSQAHQQLKNLKEAESEIKQSQGLLQKADHKVLESKQGLQVKVLVQKSQGDLLAKNKQTQNAIASYTQAFNILKANPNETDFTKDNQLLTGENIESVHRSLIKLSLQDKELKKQV
ncbi:hypothetical protein FD723_03190 [Nostoc sp. C052]|uniref:hypothetical protein n=1 Tax=Nostoc sp. C052 TaxID=2576902 RepID=UPI0015C3CBF1|nr:hypothetical protein [Nostoc sp. C052]QLE39598.1 hypothetical protein FD723_03190 [Nostoc sp. C052]